MRSSNLGLDGVDPVAFLSRLQAVQGKAEFRTKWKGKTYCFQSQKNLEIFLVTPDTYVPQYDGHCPVTYALTGKRVVGWPQHANVKNDRLYVYANAFSARLAHLCPWVLQLADLRYNHIRCKVLQLSPG